VIVQNGVICGACNTNTYQSPVRNRGDIEDAVVSFRTNNALQTVGNSESSVSTYRAIKCVDEHTVRQVGQSVEELGDVCGHDVVLEVVSKEHALGYVARVPLHRNCIHSVSYVR